MELRTYRPGIVAVFRNKNGQILLCKRSGLDSWQFPPGGIDPGEKPEEALYREALEEIGCKDFTVIRSCDRLIRYDFPEDMRAPIAKKYRGQEQYWFLCAFQDGAKPDLSMATDQEFDDLKWVPVSESLSTIVPWKRQAYEEGMKELGLGDFT